MPFKGEYHDKLAPMQAASPGALDRTAQPRLFDRAEWFDALLRHCLVGARPLIAHGTAGAAALWLPLLRGRTGRLDALSNYYSFTYAPVFTGAPDTETRMTLLRGVARGLGKRCARLVLTGLPVEDCCAEEVQHAFAAEGWMVARTVADVNHILRVNGRSFDTYWQGRPGQLRSTIKRKGKSGAVSLRIDTAFSAEAWADYERVYAQSWKGAEGSPAFLKTLAAREGAAGSLRLGLAYIGGAPVAAQFWTVEHGIALIHKLAYDSDHVAASPGSLLSAAMFQHVIDVDRVELIDFGTGDDGYKRDWMEDVRERVTLDMIRPEAPLAWPVLAKRLLRGVAARARRA